MFTGNRIDLVTAAQGTPMDVMRDCMISYVGKIPTALPRRFVPCRLPKHIEAAQAFDDIAGIVTTAEHADLVPKHMGLAVADNPVSASLHLHETLCNLDGFLWEHFDTRIHPEARIHSSAVIAERDVEIGADSWVGPGSVVMERSVIKERCHVGVGVVVGLEGFEIFEEAQPRRILKQAGGVMLCDGVTILAKSTLVRATFGGFTFLDENTMVDVLIHIAHDCVLGRDSTVVACAEISGRCELGERAYIGPNACLRNGVTVGRDAKVSMGAVVTRDVPDDAVVSGNFAVPHLDWLNFVKTLSSRGGKD